jgi:hypothetical protein
MAFGMCLAFLVLEDLLDRRVRLNALPLWAVASAYLANHFGVVSMDIIIGAVFWSLLFFAFKLFRYPLRGCYDFLVIGTSGVFLGVSNLEIAALVFVGVCYVGLFLGKYARKRGINLNDFALAVPICATMLIILEWRVYHDSMAAGFGFAWAFEHLAIPFFGMMLGGMWWITLRPTPFEHGGDDRAD